MRQKMKKKMKKSAHNKTQYMNMWAHRDDTEHTKLKIT